MTVSPLQATVSTHEDDEALKSQISTGIPYSFFLEELGPPGIFGCMDKIYTALYSCRLSVALYLIKKENSTSS